MKTKNDTMMRNIATYVWPMATMVLATGCFAPATELDETIESTETTTLKVTTRSASGETIPYPVLILAYDTEGALKGQQTLQAEGEKISLQLGTGSYHLTAVAGQSSYTAPGDYSTSSKTLALPTAGYATSPLMMGGADIALAGASASANIILTYRVASLQLKLKEVPSAVAEVSVGISQQYSKIDMNGTLSGTSTTQIRCSKGKDGNWTAEQIYLLPGIGNQTTLSLTLSQTSSQTTYSYALSEALQASVPYAIEGTYVDAQVPYITGVLTMQGWQAERTLSFDFGAGSTSGGSTSVVPSMNVSDLPTAGTAWQGHLVALVEETGTNEAELLLLSLKEWSDVHAPAAAGYETEMNSLLAAYTEGDLSDWSLPTEAEVRKIREAYADDLSPINDVLMGLGSNALGIYSTTNNARYLCESGTKTYNFAANGSITSVGKTVKYRMRAVKRIKVKK